MCPLHPCLAASHARLVRSFGSACLAPSLSIEHCHFTWSARFQTAEGICIRDQGCTMVLSLELRSEPQSMYNVQGLIKHWSTQAVTYGLLTEPGILILQIDRFPDHRSKRHDAIECQQRLLMPIFRSLDHVDTVASPRRLSACILGIRLRPHIIKHGCSVQIDSESTLLMMGQKLYTRPM